MTTYVVTRKSDGATIYTYSADAPIEWAGMEFATHDHTPLVDVVAPPVPPQQFVWEPLVFMRRFTMQERIGIRAAEKTDPIVADLFDLLRTAPMIHSDDADVLMGLGYLTQQGLLAVGRMAVILGSA